MKTVQSQDDSCARPTRVLCLCHMWCCKRFTVHDIVCGFYSFIFDTMMRYVEYC